MGVMVMPGGLKSTAASKNSLALATRGSEAASSLSTISTTHAGSLEAIPLFLRYTSMSSRMCAARAPKSGHRAHSGPEKWTSGPFRARKVDIGPAKWTSGPFRARKVDIGPAKWTSGPKADVRYYAALRTFFVCLLLLSYTSQYIQMSTFPPKCPIFPIDVRKITKHVHFPRGRCPLSAADVRFRRILSGPCQRHATPLYALMLDRSPSSVTGFMSPAGRPLLAMAAPTIRFHPLLPARSLPSASR